MDVNFLGIFPDCQYILRTLYDVQYISSTLTTTYEDEDMYMFLMKEKPFNDNLIIFITSIIRSCPCKLSHVRDNYYPREHKYFIRGVGVRNEEVFIDIHLKDGLVHNDNGPALIVSSMDSIRVQLFCVNGIIILDKVYQCCRTMREYIHISNGNVQYMNETRDYDTHVTMSKDGKMLGLSVSSEGNVFPGSISLKSLQKCTCECCDIPKVIYLVEYDGIVRCRTLI